MIVAPIGRGSGVTELDILNDAESVRIKPQASVTLTLQGPFYLWAYGVGGTASAVISTGVSSPAKHCALNLEGAIRKFKRGVAARVGNAGGGVDVCFIGDSLTRGLNDATHFRTGWVHRLKVMLQDSLNPSTVPGGYGYMKTWDTTGGIRNDAAMTIGGAVTNTAGGTSIAFGRLAQNATARTNRLIYQFDGTAADASASRRKITNIEFLMHGASGGSATTADGCLDVSAAAAPGLSAGGLFATTVDTSALGSAIPGYRVPVASLDRNANLYAQFGSGTTTPGSLNDFWSEGIIAYDGDFADGVRCHNFGAPGIASGSFASAQELTANVVRFCTGATSGARNGKLFFVALGTNDIRTAVSAATYETNLTALIDRILSQPTQPGVVLVIMPVSADASTWLGSSGGTASAIPVMDVAYKMAANREGVGLIDLHAYVGGGFHYVSAGDNVYKTNLVPNGWDGSDLIHLSAAAQPEVAQLIFDLMMDAYMTVAA